MKTMIKGDNMSPRYWLLRAFPDRNDHYSVFKNEEIIGLGWANINDLSDNNLQNLDTLFESNGYPAVSPQSMGRRVGFFKRFIQEMKIGDYVLVPDGKGEISIAIIDSSYYYKRVTKDLSHIRDVKWIKTIDFYELPKRIQQLLSNRLTMISLDKVSKELEVIIQDNNQLELQLSTEKVIIASNNNKDIKLRFNEEITKSELETFFNKILSNYF